MTLEHEADSDSPHMVESMACTTKYTVHTKADHQGSPDIRNRSFLLLPHTTGTQRWHDRLV